MNCLNFYDWEHNIIGDFMELFVIIYRTLFFYFFVILAYRIMGKREIGQLGIVDLIVSILIAELVAMSIENNKDSIFFTILPISILVALEVFLAFIGMKSKKINIFLNGKPSLIVTRGKINYHEMVKQRYSVDDLLVSLRQQSIRSIDEVEYAILEANGKLSIFPYSIFKLKGNYPMPLIIDGIIQDKTLSHIKKTKYWLLEELKKKNIDVKNIFYAFYKKSKIYIVKKS